MTLRDDVELANTQRKLEELDRLIADAKRVPGPGQDTEVQSLTLLANQLREEIVRYRSAQRRRAS